MEKTRSNYEDYWNELQELHREAKNVDDYPDEENTKQFPGNILFVFVFNFLIK